MQGLYSTFSPLASHHKSRSSQRTVSRPAALAALRSTVLLQASRTDSSGMHTGVRGSAPSSSFPSLRLPPLQSVTSCHLLAPSTPTRGLMPTSSVSTHSPALPCPGSMHKPQLSPSPRPLAQKGDSCHMAGNQHCLSNQHAPLCHPAIFVQPGEVEVPRLFLCGMWRLRPHRAQRRPLSELDSGGWQWSGFPPAHR